MIGACLEQTHSCVLEVSRNAQKGDVLGWNWQSLESDQMKGTWMRFTD